MNRTTLRWLLIPMGAAVMAWSLSTLRLADWPQYAVFVVLAVFLFRFYVEVLPTLVIPVPGLALTIGFLYVMGPPIIALRLLEPILATVIRALLPPRWREWVRAPGGGAGAVAALFWIKEPGERAAAAADWAAFSLGLAIRWWVVSQLVPEGALVHHPGAIALAEAAGYLTWGFLATLPIYNYVPFLPPARATKGESMVIQDLELVFVVTLTPFVFLVVYGYAMQGIAGAAVWPLAALGLNSMLKRLTERRNAVEEQNRRLEALNRELEHRERLSAIGKMSSVVSHQILQQLGVIGIHADLIRQANDAEPAALVAQARKNAGAIEGALRDVNRVLTDLLVFSKDLRLNLYEHPLARVVEECVEACRDEAAARGVAVRLERPTDVPVTLDKLKVKQALGNILRNALDASPRGSEVVVRAAAHDGWAEIAVTDQGPGVPETDRQAVFTPFFTTKEHGTGLGLAIAREFIEAHGGHLWVEDGHEPGATFVLQLPIVPPTRSE